MLTTNVFLRSFILAASRTRFIETTIIRPRQRGMSKCKQLYNASPQKKSSSDHLSHSTRSSQRSNECARSHRSCISLRNHEPSPAESSEDHLNNRYGITDSDKSFIMEMLIKYFADPIIYFFVSVPREE
jgi:hypothetical protein